MLAGDAQGVQPSGVVEIGGSDGLVKFGYERGADGGREFAERLSAAPHRVGAPFQAECPA
jgi:hypothetical protein